MDRKAFRKYLEFNWFLEDEEMEKPSLKYRIKTWIKILFVPNSVARWIRRRRAERKGPLIPLPELKEEWIDEIKRRTVESLRKKAVEMFPETTEGDWKIRHTNLDEDITDVLSHSYGDNND